MSGHDKQRNLMKYAGLGTQWMILLLLAVWGGMKLDGITGWKFPVFVVTLPLVALCYSMWQLIREFNKPKK